eukprot:TRINITY_DN18636_c0_g1_i1.p1 TRINITY_DN18636_c0_g1~~TRINITY_DN18636_c0_g1_i1.p1  ORF type:complete len:316 (+),score=65.57 TRINITY_DN18636_c0_g1_i1:44-949(+)
MERPTSLLLLGLVLAVRPAWKVARHAIALVMTRVKQAIARHVSDLLVAVLQELATDRCMNRLLQVVSNSISKAKAHEEFKRELKDVIVEAMRVEQLHNEIVGTLTGSMVAASKDKSMRAALLSVITSSLKDEGFMQEMLDNMTAATVSAANNKELLASVLTVAKIAITDAMKDAGFVADVTSTMASAGISVARDEAVRDAMLGVAKAAVLDALRDEAFLDAIRGSLADSLRDGNIYRGAAAGMVGALNPFRRTRTVSDQTPIPVPDGEEEINNKTGNAGEISEFDVPNATHSAHKISTSFY